MTAPVMAPQAHLPSTRSKASERQQAAVTMVRDLWLGAERVREQEKTYLPQAPGEEYVHYQSRLARSVFTNFFRKAIEGLCGLVFRVDPALGDDVPAQIVKHWENLDNTGTHGAVFLRDLMQDAMVAGHGAFLVEYPNTGGHTLNRAEEAQVQPYWVPLKKEQLLSWRTTTEDGRLVLTQLVIEEVSMVPEGPFGEKEQKRYRVFTRDRGPSGTPAVSVRVLEVTDNQKVVEVAGSFATYPTQIDIPVVEVPTSGRRSLFESDPPLLDVAYLNVAHYQVRSDYHTSIHKTCVPIFVETGVEATGEAIVLGPNSARSYSNPDADAKYISHDGAALASVKGALDDLKDEIGTLGVAMLAPQKRAAETVEAKRLDKSVGDSALAVSARALQDAVERGLAIHARYLGLDGGGSVVVNRDFEGSLMDPAVMTAFVDAAARIGFPLRMLLREFQSGGRIADDVDLDELEGEMEAAKAAIDAQAQMDAERAKAEQDEQRQAA